MECILLAGSGRVQEQFAAQGGGVEQKSNEEGGMMVVEEVACPACVAEGMRRERIRRSYSGSERRYGGNGNLKGTASLCDKGVSSQSFR